MVGLLDALSPEKMVKELGRIGGYAHGNYITKCRLCDRHFIGDKRAFECLPCVVTKLKEAANPKPEVRENDGNSS